MSTAPWRINRAGRPIGALITAAPGSALAAVTNDLFWGGAVAYTANLAETVSLSEALAASAARSVALAESTSLAEALAGSLAASAALSETVALAEALAGSLAASAALAETTALSEALGAAQDASVALAESTTLAEALWASAALSAALSEALSLAESVEGEQSGAAQQYTANLAESIALAEALTVLVLRARGARTLVAQQSTRTATAAQSTRELLCLMPDVATPTFFRTEQGQVDYQLREDGAVVDLTGLAVNVVVLNRRTNQRDTRAVTVLDAAAGKVRAIWPPRTLQAGTYDLQILVTPPGGGTPSAWPRQGYASLIVQEPL